MVMVMVVMMMMTTMIMLMMAAWAGPTSMDSSGMLSLEWWEAVDMSARWGRWPSDQVDRWERCAEDLTKATQ